MVRLPGLSTLISYHPPHTHRTTAAHTLRTRLLAAGQSVYWNKIFEKTISHDPTFVLLALLWYPLYAFDESLDALYLHISWLVRISYRVSPYGRSQFNFGNVGRPGDSHDGHDADAAVARRPRASLALRVPPR